LTTVSRPGIPVDFVGLPEQAIRLDQHEGSIVSIA
jgi:hypothetical protein